MLRITAVLWLALVSLPALAHDLWIEKEGPEYVLRYGHRGGAVLLIEAAKLKHILCVNEDDQKVDVLSKAVIEQKAVRIKDRCKCLSVFYYNGYYSLTPDGEKNLPKNQVNDAVKSWESKEFIKFIETGSGDVTFGDEFEITVGGDIRTLHTGDKITVRVLYQGAPAAGATIACHGHVIGETDSKGEARVRLRQGGLQFVAATLKRPLNIPEADSLALTAGLLFEVAP